MTRTKRGAARQPYERDTTGVHVAVYCDGPIDAPHKRRRLATLSCVYSGSEDDPWLWLADGTRYYEPGTNKVTPIRRVVDDVDIDIADGVPLPPGVAAEHDAELHRRVRLRCANCRMGPLNMRSMAHLDDRLYELAVSENPSISLAELIELHGTRRKPL